MRSSDISPKALESLKTSRIKRVIITGRRGPLQSAFTTKELREILAIPEMRFKTDPKLLDEQIAEATEYLSTNRPKKRLVELIRKGALQTASKCSKSLEMLYNANPAGFRLDSTGSVSNIILQRTVLQGQVPDVKCVGTKEFFDIDCGLVIKSVGFNTEPLEGLPFDEGKNRYFNDRGKVKGVPGLYVSGWLKSGPVGVIASTMYDAFETADTILMDSPTLISSEKQGLTNEEISSLGATSFADWESLDTAELKRGKEAGKARVKVESIEEMVSIMRDT